MTEEDQKLVALAALHGARFTRRPSDHNEQMMVWISTRYSDAGKWSLPRAAEFYLYKEGLRSAYEHLEYDAATDCGYVTEVDAQLLAQFGALD